MALYIMAVKVRICERNQRIRSFRGGGGRERVCKQTNQGLEFNLYLPGEIVKLDMSVQ